MVDTETEPIETIPAIASRTVLLGVIGAIAILIPAINMQFGTHILLPTEPQQQAIVTLIEFIVALGSYLIIIYRRMSIQTGKPIKGILRSK